ncbi:hypothetical protein BV20DRAFT_49833 [Pilatotrama ljubarskyi]|nr:hypothetical protein BV20DRAFT_49833 [Pilatotrama ljubarskyi]
MTSESAAQNARLPCDDVPACRCLLSAQKRIDSRPYKRLPPLGHLAATVVLTDFPQRAASTTYESYPRTSPVDETSAQRSPLRFGDRSPGAPCAGIQRYPTASLSDHHKPHIFYTPIESPLPVTLSAAAAVLVPVSSHNMLHPASCRFLC